MLDVPAGIGAPRVRVEDEPLLRGNARFIDDINLAGQGYAAFVRSAMPSARILRIDVEQARKSPGVIAILTHAEMTADGVGRIHSPSNLKSADGTPIRNPQQTALTDHARFVGDTLAMVVAQSPAQADDAALLVEVDYDDAPPAIDPAAALLADAPLVWPEFGTNLALDWEWGKTDEVEAAFARAHHVSRITVTNNRLVVAALEPRGAVAQYDAATERYTVWTPTQGGTPVQTALANPGLGVAPSQVRVITPEVGGGFGIKNLIYPEQILVAWAAKKLSRPIKWYASRTDAFLTDYHARDHEMTGELALDDAGNFLAIRSDVLSNMGAYLTGAAPVIPTGGGTRMLANVYRVPLAAARTRCVFTHTAPISAFRGAGKPEYAHLVEQLVDQAARDLGIPSAQLRARNLISPEEMPYTTPTGMVYDSGDFAARMHEALDAIDAASTETRRAEAAARGKLYGLGYSVYTEPDGFKDNRAELSFDPSGHLTVITSAQTNGQGHASAYTQIATSLLGVEPSRITIVEGDTDRTGFASGSGGSRSTTVTGAAMHISADALISKAKRIAAQLLEASEADIAFDAGRFEIVGTDARVGWDDIARVAHNPGALPPGVTPGLAADHHYDAPVYCFPSGCHVCEVEIDSDTGSVEIVRYVNSSDFGTMINPLIVEGQLQGGIAQGVGQVLYEHTVYEPESGQLLSGSFMDYCIPRATQLPAFETNMAPTVCTTNPLGVKGVGESGPTAAIPAVANAVFDALRDHDVSTLRMPFTSERIWRVLRSPMS
ncbi:MAG: xanthine dehydrogenase family protein molybdopterin-binding subunit [Gammaproteobacteria bacterium]|nr:xanthine dehydrogenase family protein molybdopterin-binding subunit [Gammaproteobacteria bacterium]